MAHAFPKGFVWGAATAAHQVEGQNVHSDCWALEQLPGRGSPFRERSGDACDHYHRYREDIAVLADLGFNAYRFSVEWARVEPEEGVFSNAALDHYKRMADACVARGLTPFVTLHHFTSPLWLALGGGWNRADAPELFARYCERAARRLGGDVGAYCTLNEPNIIVAFADRGTPEGRARFTARVKEALAQRYNAPDFSSFFFNQGETAASMKRAHGLAVAAVRAAAPGAPVGFTLALQDMQALPGGAETMRAARARVQDAYLDLAADDDFIGVQTYSRDLFGPDGQEAPPPGAALTQMGYEDYPQALGHTVAYAAQRAGKPIYVTENGLATHDDTRREGFIREALKSLAEAMAAGADVRGYFYWSLFDNFEWTLGYDKTFGLIGVDRESFARSVKESARALGAIARANALP